MSAIDETHDPGRGELGRLGEWPQRVPDPEFAARRLQPARRGAARGGVAIGDMIFDLGAALEAGLFSGEAAKAAEGGGAGIEPADGARRRAAARLAQASLGIARRRRRRARPVEGLSAKLLHPSGSCTMHLPAAIGEFTDFFAGIHHARNGGRRRDPNNPLNLNYK